MSSSNERVSTLPGIPDLAQRLHEDRARVILCAYKAEVGDWHYIRFNDNGPGVETAEIGAMAKMLMWLNELQAADDEID